LTRSTLPLLRKQYVFHVFKSGNKNKDAIAYKILIDYVKKNNSKIYKPFMIKDILDNIGLSSTSIRTYDIENQEFLKPLVIGTNTEVITENLFDHYYRYFRDEQTKNKITQYIQQEGLTIVLCDGGCKKCEYNILAPLLKTGDIIMAHDYAPDRDFFEKHMKNQIWDWMEIEDKNIKDISEKYNLTPYNQEEMLSIAWNCRKKI
jgi:hypothetical protein